MKKYSKEELAKVLEKHKKWLDDLDGGEKADLSGADLHSANLSETNLSEVNLSRADLYKADLSGADLYGTDLSGANLYGANLSWASLEGANLSRAKLSRAKLDKAASDRLSIVPEVGSFVGWKKVRTDTGTAIVKLLIPEDAPRSNATGRKCRSGWAVVLEGEGVSGYDGSTRYAPGVTVKADSFDPDRWKECAPGIHFFITRSEAEAYNL